jgi:hypothetical protein
LLQRLKEEGREKLTGGGRRGAGGEGGRREEYLSDDLDLFYSLNRSPLNHGNMINHRPTPERQNVTYMEFFLPPKFPPPLRSFIPNVYLNLENCELCSDVEEGLKMVVLVSLRDIKDEELFSDYNWIGCPGRKD